MNKQILIIDYGSQYTYVIARVVFELGFYCEIVPWNDASKWLTENNPKLVIISGSDKSVYAPGAPTIPEGFDFSGKSYHVFAVCYGMQLIAHNMGGVVERDKTKSEYGLTKIQIASEHFLFKNLPKEQDVWMSHGDSVTKTPEGYRAVASSRAIAVITNLDTSVNAVQFHPEVSHTTYGKQILENVVVHAGCVQDWKITDHITLIQQEMRDAISGIENPCAVLGLSGGVDSAVAAALAAPVFGKNLHCIIIDHGGLRKDDLSIAIETAKMLGVSYEVIDTSAEFLQALGQIEPHAGKEHSEELRKVFSRGVYQNTFDSKAVEHKAHFIIQGTNAADLTESGALGTAAVIKSHHNIGINFVVSELMPLAKMYKYQIRALGKALGLKEDVWNREPFPGPGLYLRVVDTTITKEKLDIVRDADHIVRTILKKHGCLEHISQLVVALLGSRAVGVKGDERVYNMPISIRPVVSTDFMTTSPFYIHSEIMLEIETEVTKHPSISRVLWDYTSKPPATTEYQ